MSSPLKKSTNPIKPPDLSELQKKIQSRKIKRMSESSKTDKQEKLTRENDERKKKLQELLYKKQQQQQRNLEVISSTPIENKTRSSVMTNRGKTSSDTKKSKLKADSNDKSDEQDMSKMMLDKISFLLNDNDKHVENQKRQQFQLQQQQLSKNGKLEASLDSFLPSNLSGGASESKEDDSSSTGYSNKHDRLKKICSMALDLQSKLHQTKLKLFNFNPNEDSFEHNETNLFTSTGIESNDIDNNLFGTKASLDNEWSSGQRLIKNHLREEKQKMRMMEKKCIFDDLLSAKEMNYENMPIEYSKGSLSNGDLTTRQMSTSSKFVSPHTACSSSTGSTAISSRKVKREPRDMLKMDLMSIKANKVDAKYPFKYDKSNSPSSSTFASTNETETNPFTGHINKKRNLSSTSAESVTKLTVNMSTFKSSRDKSSENGLLSNLSNEFEKSDNKTSLLINFNQTTRSNQSSSSESNNNSLRYKPSTKSKTNKLLSGSTSHGGKAASLVASLANARQEKLIKNSLSQIDNEENMKQGAESSTTKASSCSVVFNSNSAHFESISNKLMSNKLLGVASSSSDNKQIGTNGMSSSNRKHLEIIEGKATKFTGFKDYEPINSTTLDHFTLCSTHIANEPSNENISINTNGNKIQRDNPLYFEIDGTSTNQLHSSSRNKMKALNHRSSSVGRNANAQKVQTGNNADNRSPSLSSISSSSSSSSSSTSRQEAKSTIVHENTKKPKSERPTDKPVINVNLPEPELPFEPNNRRMSYGGFGDEDDDMEKSFRQVLPSEMHYKKSKQDVCKEANNHSLLNDISQISSIYMPSEPNNSTARLNFENDSFRKFTGEIVKKYMQEEEMRSKHQSHLLKLREKALIEKTDAKLTWLEQMKRKAMDKGEDEKMPSILKKEKGIIQKLKQEQENINKIKEVQRKATENRLKMLSQHSEVIKWCQNNLRKQSSGTLNWPERTTASELVTKSEASFNEPIDEVLKECAEDEHTYLDDTVNMSQSLMESKLMKQVKQHMNSEKYLTEREKKLRLRRKQAEDIIAWKKKLDDEEQQIKQIEKQARKVLIVNKSLAPNKDSLKQIDEGVEEKSSENGQMASKPQTTTTELLVSRVSNEVKPCATKTPEAKEATPFKTIITHSNKITKREKVDLSELESDLLEKSNDLSSNLALLDAKTPTSSGSGAQTGDELEFKVKKLKDELSKKKSEAEKLKQTFKEKEKSKLKEKEEFLRKKINSYDLFIDKIKNALNSPLAQQSNKENGDEQKKEARLNQSKEAGVGNESSHEKTLISINEELKLGEEIVSPKNVLVDNTNVSQARHEDKPIDKSDKADIQTVENKENLITPRKAYANINYELNLNFELHQSPRAQSSAEHCTKSSASVVESKSAETSQPLLLIKSPCKTVSEKTQTWLEPEPNRLNSECEWKEKSCEYKEDMRIEEGESVQQQLDNKLMSQLDTSFEDLLNKPGIWLRKNEILYFVDVAIENYYWNKLMNQEDLLNANDPDYFNDDILNNPYLDKLFHRRQSSSQRDECMHQIDDSELEHLETEITFKYMLFNLVGELMHDLYLERYENDERTMCQFYPDFKCSTHKTFFSSKLNGPSNMSQAKHLIKKKMLQILRMDNPNISSDSSRKISSKFKRTLACKQLDLVDTLLYNEMRSKEQDWSNYETEEFEAKLMTYNAIFDSVLSDTINCFQLIHLKKEKIC